MNAPEIKVPVISTHRIGMTFLKQQPGLLGRGLAALGVPLAPPQGVRALDDVSIEVMKGEVVGLVGESGCGKSTLGRIVAGIMPPTTGTLRFLGKERGEMSPLERYRAKVAVQMIFQDPFASLNPRQRVADIIGEAPLVHGIVGRAELADYVDEVMLKCGIDAAYKLRFPHQFSGGQRQRIGIARALAVKPQFLVCDESVAALDVSIQAQIINLFMDLRRDLDLTYLFISHDLGVVEHIADRVVIMYLGRVVETAPTEELFARPRHPYTQALLANMPRLSTGKQAFGQIKGEIPSPLNPPSGCHFHPRCPFAAERCRVERPAARALGPRSFAACHRIEDGR
jgi:peptide/nickel transport system ATP-binding protein